MEEEIKNMGNLKSAKELMHFLMIINSFCYITGEKEVTNSLLETISNIELDGLTIIVYLTLVSSVSLNQNNAYKLKDQVKKIFDLALTKFDYNTSVFALSQIMNTVKQKEGSYNSLGLSFDDINLIRDDIESIPVFNELSQPFNINNYLYASIFAISFAIPYSFIRSSIRLVPSRGFSQALPLILKSVFLATLGSSKFLPVF
jgi:hypothetical protein